MRRQIIDWVCRRIWLICLRTCHIAWEMYLVEDSFEEYTIVESFLIGTRKYRPHIDSGRVLCLRINWRLQL